MFVCIGSLIPHLSLLGLVCRDCHLLIKGQRETNTN